MAEETQASSPGARDAPPSGPRLGDVLLEAKLITPDELNLALALQREGDRRRLGSILLEKGWLDPESLATALSIHLNLPLIDLTKQTVQPEALNLIPEETARRHHVMPLEVIDGNLVVVMEDPTNVQVIEELVAISGRNIVPTVGVSSEIEAAIDLYYKSTRVIEREIAKFAPSAEVIEDEEARRRADIAAQDPVVRAVDLILKQAVRDRASDIHIEPAQDIVHVRYRIDGILHETLSLPSSSHHPLLSRLKVLAGMNIAEWRRPQDGQFSFQVGDDEIFFRMATSDSTWGEMAVLRVLGRSDFILDLPGLGFLPESLEAFRRLIESPFGMVLVSGPTGSGKTTTLYAALNQLDRHRLNIMTIEDPVEYRFHGIHQIQVNRAADINFASGLRGIMRLDPDVIMVGEVRDSETAEAATQAALTGHLVLSSIHANDAPGSLHRLAHLGVERYLLVSAVVGVVSQRLVRRVCPHCKVFAEPSPEERAAYTADTGDELTHFHAGEGCNLCAQTGFIGRTGVFEVMLLSEATRKLLLQGASAGELKAQAQDEGMISMRQDGMLKVKQGITTPREVMRNVYTLG